MDLEDMFDDIICTNTGSQYFDEAIGHIEDIVLSTEFEYLQKKFFETYWHRIENTEENKLEYMDIFNEYTWLLESHLMKELTERMHGFDLQRFAKELEENNAFRNPQESGEIFELLYSFSSFQTFKNILLDYRREMEGNMQHLNCDVLTTKPLSRNAASTSSVTEDLGTVFEETKTATSTQCEK